MRALTLLIALACTSAGCGPTYCSLTGCDAEYQHCQRNAATTSAENTCARVREDCRRDCR